MPSKRTPHVAGEISIHQDVAAFRDVQPDAQTWLVLLLTLVLRPRFHGAQPLGRCMASFLYSRSFQLAGRAEKNSPGPQQMWPKRNHFNCLARVKIHTPSLGWIQGIQHRERGVKKNASRSCMKLLLALSRLAAEPWQHFLGILRRPLPVQLTGQQMAHTYLLMIF